MYKILSKRSLNQFVTEMYIEAPLVSKKAKPGQFIILRVDQDGERIPLTIAGVKGDSVRIIFQIVGATTYLLNQKEAGEFIEDFAGPLGCKTDLEGIKKALIIGGGVGCAIALPIVSELKNMGADVTSIIGFRNKDLVILEDEFKASSNHFYVTTDDGSYGLKGNVTIKEKELLEKEKFDCIITIGPLIMMKFVTLTAKEFDTKVIVSMNPIMIDGTGMCGGCRVTLKEDGKRITKFACVDGPDFDGAKVDFDEAISRNRIYQNFERKAYDKACNLMAKGE